MKIAAVLVVVALCNFELCSAAECSNWEQPVLTANYTPQGQVVFAAGMDTYETGDRNSTKVLIAVYDIYVFNPGPNIMQICDRLGEYGYRVIMPDFFHGEPWKRDHYPYPTDEEFRNFVRQTSWNESVRADMGLVLQEYKRQNNATEFGIFGFCFGGKIVAHALDEYADDIKVGAQFHPAGADINDALRIKRPSILLPGSNDPDMTDYCIYINIILGPGSCVYYHFRDVNHGYAGGRADWTNPLIVGRASEAVGMFEQFLCDKFPV